VHRFCGARISLRFLQPSVRSKGRDYDERRRGGYPNPSASSHLGICACLNERALVCCEILRTLNEPMARPSKLISGKQRTFLSILRCCVPLSHILFELTFGNEELALFKERAIEVLPFAQQCLVRDLDDLHFLSAHDATVFYDQAGFSKAIYERLRFVWYLRPACNTANKL